MTIECEGIVLRQTKALKGRRMILLFTDRFGKVSAGTNISERGKGKSAIAVRPFTLGRYSLRRDRGYTNIISAESVKSYYSIGEDYEKYVNASLVLEFAGRMLPEEAPAPELWAATFAYLKMMEDRARAHRTLTVAWLVKAIDIAGVLPDAGNFENDKLFSALGFDKLEALAYLMGHPMEKVAALGLDEDMANALIRALLRFAERYLDIGNLKSEALFMEV
ncbi:MAG: DNA repair protein RecO [Clostridiales Family XIII bacterium]|jgi:DNA repair protein RecO (recombination protein O)|nr:DNA repair protein RecO [Clostridiales Family XIII bacterium]